MRAPATPFPNRHIDATHPATAYTGGYYWRDLRLLGVFPGTYPRNMYRQQQTTTPDPSGASMLH
ncbi:hypothetical protein ACWEOW_23225 [Monashia sp. NPDC004114]